MSVNQCNVLFLISGAGKQAASQKYDDWKPFHASQLGFLAIQLDDKEMHGRFLAVNNKPIEVWNRKAVSDSQSTAQNRALRQVWLAQIKGL